MKKIIKKGQAKGFTLTELVIVIVIIAILAAILIPTYTGYVQKAKLSNDQQTVININTFLLHASVDTPEQIDTLEEIQEFITTKGYSNPLSTSSADSEFGVYISGTAGFDGFIARIYLADATYSEYGLITNLKASYFEDGSDSNVTLDVINAKIASDKAKDIAYDKMCLSYTIKSVSNKETRQLIGEGVTASNGKNITFEGDTLTNDVDHYTLTKSSDSKTVTLSKAGASTGDFVIPDGVTNVNTNAFCTPVNGKVYNPIKDQYQDYDDYVHGTPSKITSVKIPDSVTTIGSQAFQKCSDLVTVTMSDSVTSIGTYAFSGCTSLKEIDIPKSVDTVDSNAFNGCTALTKITVDAKEIGSQAFNGCTSLTEANLGDNVQTIAYQAFNGCEKLTTVNLGDNITSINNEAFKNCTSLKNITIPSSVTEILGETFSGCTNLTEIVIPDSVKCSLGGTFDGCTSLTKAVIGNGVTNLVQTFYGCTSLTTVSIANGVQQIGGYAFYNCTSLEEIDIPDSVTGTLGTEAFYGCKSLKSITIPNNITEIDSYAFSGCASLTSIVIPDSVTKIEMYAFENCSKLETLTIGKGVNSLAQNLTAGCTSLTTINYTGTSTEWNSVSYKASDPSWNTSNVHTLHCSDADVTC